MWTTRTALGSMAFFGDGYALLRRFRSELAIWRDFFRTRKEVAYLRRLPDPAPDAPRALLVNINEFIYESKLQAMFAVALKLHGWRPVVLLDRGTSRWARRYLHAFGIDDLIYRDCFKWSETQGCEYLAAAARFTAGDLTFPNVKEWRYRHSWIGPQILSTVARRGMLGAPDPEDPEIRARIVDLLPTVLGEVHRSEKIVDHVRPSLCVVFEANYAPYGALVDTVIDRGSDVIFASQPWKDDALMCKRLTKESRRLSPSSVSKGTLDRLLERPWAASDEGALWDEMEARYGGTWFLQGRNQQGARMQDEEKLRAKFSLLPDRKVAVVFSHVLWDANLFYGEDIFDDYGDWFVQTLVAAAENDALDWIIKLHPANLWKRAYENVTGEYAELSLIRSRIGELPQHVHLMMPDTEISSLSLYRFGDYGVTVRGTPGMEMACFGKPIFTAGTGRYSGLGFTVDSGSREEYLDRLGSIQDYPRLSSDETLLAKRHAHAVFRLRHWKLKSFEASFVYRKRGSHPLDHNLHVRARSTEEIHYNGDLKRWVSWAVDSSQEDYLEEPVHGAVSDVQRVT